MLHGFLVALGVGKWRRMDSIPYVLFFLSDMIDDYDMVKGCTWFSGCTLIY